jgi:hypothetical protein
VGSSGNGHNLRMEVMKEFSINKISDLGEEVSNYAKLPLRWYEFFSEAMAEYLNASEPKRVAKWIGERVMRSLYSL